MLETDFRNFDILAFTETWLNSEIDNSDIMIDSTETIDKTELVAV